MTYAAQDLQEGLGAGDGGSFDPRARGAIARRSARSPTPTTPQRCASSHPPPASPAQHARSACSATGQSQRPPPPLDHWRRRPQAQSALRLEPGARCASGDDGLWRAPPGPISRQPDAAPPHVLAGALAQLSPASSASWWRTRRGGRGGRGDGQGRYLDARSPGTGSSATPPGPITRTAPCIPLCRRI